MSKRHFIALADAIRNHNSAASHPLGGGRFHRIHRRSVEGTELLLPQDEQ